MAYIHYLGKETPYRAHHAGMGFYLYIGLLVDSWHTYKTSLISLVSAMIAAGHSEIVAHFSDLNTLSMTIETDVRRLK